MGWENASSAAQASQGRCMIFRALALRARPTRIMGTTQKHVVDAEVTCGAEFIWLPPSSPPSTAVSAEGPGTGRPWIWRQPSAQGSRRALAWSADDFNLVNPRQRQPRGFLRAVVEAHGARILCFTAATSPRGSRTATQGPGRDDRNACGVSARQWLSVGMGMVASIQRVKRIATWKSLGGGGVSSWN